MNINLINQKILQSFHIGLAIIDADNLDPIFANEHFQSWFQTSSDAPLGLLEKENEVITSIENLQSGKTWTSEIAIKVRRRQLALSIHLSCIPSSEQRLVVIEIHNTTRIKELESMIQSYSSLVERNERILKREKERAEKLLLNIMPKSVFEELKEFGVTAPQRYEEASVLMLDFVGFTQMSIADDPASIVSELNDIFTNFDRIVEQFGCERIKTIGDAYMAVSGLPDPNPDHAHNIARVALLFIHYLQQRNKSHPAEWKARIGIATGPLIGSIIGIQKYVYDIFGPAVNLASRMESQCDPMEILLCDPIRSLVIDEFNTKLKGEFEIKGFGQRILYTLGGPISGHFDL